MSYFSYGAIAAVGFVAVVGGFAVADRGMNYKPAKANIFLIDRECRYDRVWTDGKRETVTDSCSSTDKFKELAAQSPAQRKKAVDGTAVVKVSYTAPQDGSYQTSQLKFTGRDEEFYKLKAGDEMKILVSNKDHSKIIKG
ncbi:hypothetical protein [Sphingomonas daechungensis]|uniref:hypothetical protein n=1 Tax=Sphingomonas daechungensis TaxID=1176646 RepID=UPI003783EEBB